MSLANQNWSNRKLQVQYADFIRSDATANIHCLDTESNETFTFCCEKTIFYSTNPPNKIESPFNARLIELREESAKDVYEELHRIDGRPGTSASGNIYRLFLDGVANSVLVYCFVMNIIPHSKP